MKTASAPTRLSILCPGNNWVKVGALLSLGLTGYYGRLPRGSTVASVSGDTGSLVSGAPSLVADGTYDMALTTPSWYAKMAADGTGFFSQPLPILRLATLPHDDRLILAVREETGIGTLRELVDSRTPLKISTPPLDTGHPAGLVANEVLKMYGSSLATLEQSGGTILKDRPRQQQTAEVPVDPSFDAIFDEAIMTRRWERIFSRYRLRVLNIDEDVLAAMEARGFRRGVIPCGRFPGMTQDVSTIDFSGWELFTRADLPDEIAFLTLEGLDEQKDALRSMFPADSTSPLTGPVDLALSWKKSELDLHPGAEEYYRQKGYLK